MTGRIHVTYEGRTSSTREKWQDDALCAQVGTEMFFPEAGRVAHKAKKLCAECPVREACLAYALKNEERYGIWGGLAWPERRALRSDAA